MCLLEFFLKERERKNKHNFEGLHACKKFPTLLLNVWAYPIWELGVVCTIIFLQLNNYCINLNIQKHFVNFKERERQSGEDRHNFWVANRRMMLRNVKLSNPNRFFFPPNSVNVRESQFSMKHCVVLIQREKESRLAQILRRTM